MLNRIVLVGRLTRDPELRSTTNGTPVVSFTLASDDTYRKGPNGEKQTIFMNCSMFGNRAETVQRYTHKGSLVAVEGRLTQRKYTNKQNVQITLTEINCDNVEFLDPKGSHPAEGYSPEVQPSEDMSQTEGGSLGAIDVSDDDLPF